MERPPGRHGVHIMKVSNRVGGRVGGRVLGLLAMGAGFAFSSVASAQQQTGEYQAHWAVGTWLTKTKMVDYQAQIDLSNTTIKRDTVVLYESWLGNFPYAGPHLTEQGNYMQQHLAKVQQDIAKFIPDVNFSGYAVIDYETWYPQWARLMNVKSDKAADFRDHDFKDDWEDHIKRNRPQVIAGLAGEAKERALAASYNQAAQRFYLETLRECKRLRPKAKWGYYGFPYREYYVDYLPYSSVWKQSNADMGWLFDAVDVVFPTVYSLFVTVEDREPSRTVQENTPARNAMYIMENTKEAIRVAKGKPVLPFIHFRYHPSVRNFAGQIITDTVIRQMAELPKQAGAQGVMVWDCIESEAQFRELRDVVLNRFAPKIDAVAQAPMAAGSKVAANAKAAPTATKLPNGQVVIGNSKPAKKIANVPN